MESSTLRSCVEWLIVAVFAPLFLLGIVLAGLWFIAFYPIKRHEIR